MNLSIASTLIAIFALIGYTLMRLFLPDAHFERLIFLGAFAVIAIFFMYLSRRQKRKEAIAN